VQTCSRCNASSPDQAANCVRCNADLGTLSATAVALRRFKENQRVKAIRVTVAHDACPICFGLMKTYPKDLAPALPHPGCSHPDGCRCFYEPVLEETAIVGKAVK